MTETANILSYEEYMHCFALKQSIKKMLKKLNMPMDEAFQMNNLDEEALFMRHWDIKNFSASADDTPAAKQWYDEEHQRIVSTFQQQQSS